MKKVLNLVRSRKNRTSTGAPNETETFPNTRSRSLTSLVSSISVGLTSGATSVSDIHSHTSKTKNYNVDLNKDKLTKLHRACWKGKLETVNKLSLDKKEAINAVDSYGRTGLHYASAQGFLDIVHVLVDSKVDIDLKDSDGKTAALKAAECLEIDCAQYLYEKGSDINAFDKEGNTALHVVAETESRDFCSFLLRKGAKLEISNENGDQPLHVAASCDNLAIASMLLQHGAPVNETNFDMQSPLMLAAPHGNEELLKLFLEYGASLHFRDAKGWSAEDHAAAKGHHAVAKLLADQDDLPKYHEMSVDVPRPVKTSETKTAVSVDIPVEFNDNTDLADLDFSQLPSGFNTSMHAEMSFTKSSGQKKMEIEDDKHDDSWDDSQITESHRERKSKSISTQKVASTFDGSRISPIKEEQQQEILKQVEWSDTDISDTAEDAKVLQKGSSWAVISEEQEPLETAAVNQNNNLSDINLLENVKKDVNDSSWDSESSEGKSQESKEASLSPKIISQDKPLFSVSTVGTYGREGTLQGYEEMWESNAQLDKIPAKKPRTSWSDSDGVSDDAADNKLHSPDNILLSPTSVKSNIDQARDEGTMTQEPSDFLEFSDIHGQGDVLHEAKKDLAVERDLTPSPPPRLRRSVNKIITPLKHHNDSDSPKPHPRTKRRKSQNHTEKIRQYSSGESVDSGPKSDMELDLSEGNLSLKTLQKISSKVGTTPKFSDPDFSETEESQHSSVGGLSKRIGDSEENDVIKLRCALERSAAEKITCETRLRALQKETNALEDEFRDALDQVKRWETQLEQVESARRHVEQELISEREQRIKAVGLTAKLREQLQRNEKLQNTSHVEMEEDMHKLRETVAEQKEANKNLLNESAANAERCEELTLKAKTLENNLEIAMKQIESYQERERESADLVALLRTEQQNERIQRQTEREELVGQETEARRHVERMREEAEETIAKLRKDTTLHIEEKNEAQREMWHWKSECESNQMVREKLEADLTRLSEQLGIVSGEVDVLQRTKRQSDVLQSELEILQQSKDDQERLYKSRIEALQKQVEMFESQAKVNVDRVHGFHNDVEYYRQEMEKERRESDRLGWELRENEKVLNEERRAKDDLQRQIQRLRVEMTSLSENQHRYGNLHDDAESQWAEEKRGLLRQLSETEAERDELQSNVTRLEKKLATVQTKLDGISEVVENRNQAVTLKENLDSALQEVAKYRQQVSDMSALLSERETSLITEKKRLASLEVAVTEETILEKKLLDKTRLVDELSSQLNETKEELSRSDQDLKRLRQIAEEQREQLNRLESENETYLRQLEDPRFVLAKERVQRVEDECLRREETQEKLRELEREYGASQAILREQVEKCDKLLRERENYKADVEKEKETSDKLRQKLVQLREQLRASKQQIDNLTEQLLHKSDNPDKRIAELTSSFESEKHAWERSFRHLKEKNDDLIKEIAILSASNTALEQQGEHLRELTKVSKYQQKEILQMSKVKDHLQDQLADINKRLKENYVPKSRIEKIRTEFDSLVAHLRHDVEMKARIELNAKLQEVNNYLLEHSAEQAKLDELRSSCEVKLKASMMQKEDKLTQDLEEAKSILASKTVENETLRLQLDHMKNLYETQQIPYAWQLSGNTSHNSDSVYVADQDFTNIASPLMDMQVLTSENGLLQGDVKPFSSTPMKN